MLSANDLSFFVSLFGNYRVSDQANKAGDNNVTYMGSVDRKGRWYILEQTRSGTTLAYRYVKGDSAYTTAWTAREAQSYDYFYEVFK